jgi:hypothetical protein
LQVSFAEVDLLIENLSKIVIPTRITSSWTPIHTDKIKITPNGYNAMSINSIQYKDTVAARTDRE